MIETRFRGKPVSSIPEEAFTSGFTITDCYPTLVLASVDTVPTLADEHWRLAYEQASGHYCNTFFFAVRELTIRPELMAAVRGIADDAYTLENMAYFESLSFERKEAARNDYLNNLGNCGLTCSAHYLSQLTQTLYPVDATPDNLRKLSAENIDLTALPADGLVLFVTGPWI
ncbi:hypothetical protein [Buttiauxella gaviniae]|uniref:hypothetical protein n=1 Tax=Buttiauxella gaviniae TaxID=82990 RepID=UPI003C71CBDE